MHNFLATLPRWVKLLIAMSMDFVAIVGALFTAICLRLNDNWPIETFERSYPLLALLVIVGLALSYYLSLSSIRLRSYERSSVVRAMIWSLILMIIGVFANAIFSLGAPRTVPIIFGFIVFVYSISLRLNALAFMNFISYKSDRIPVAIYGAGAAGLQLISALKTSSEYRPVLIVDDNIALKGLLVSGLKVHSRSSLMRLIKSGSVAKVLLAMPSIGVDNKQRIINEISELNCEIIELPSYVDMIKDGGVLQSLKPISPEKLLGRDGVNLEIPELTVTYAGKNVMVTGAGGSIGSELCRKIIAIKPKKLVLFDQSEFALYKINMELVDLVKGQEIEIVQVLGSVTDRNRAEGVVKDEGVEIILHAAAYKHVPIVECNEAEAVRTNLIGTYNMANIAVKCGIERFIMISTDKAVRPTNVMGASKRLAELVVQDIRSKQLLKMKRSKKKSTPCIIGIVRFGNVLGSSGSVVPLFEQQIAKGGPITITDQEVTRYFMTISEAAFLVLLAGTYAESSEVFVLDMGEPVKIIDLAKNMVKLSRLSIKNEDNPDGDIELIVTGLRPGEKLYEELLIGGDNLPTPHPKILRASEKSDANVDSTEIYKVFDKAILANDAENIRGLLKNWVEDYSQWTKVK